jgi:hypothetical protein
MSPGHRLKSLDNIAATPTQRPDTYTYVQHPLPEQNTASSSRTALGPHPNSGDRALLKRKEREEDELVDELEESEYGESERMNGGRETRTSGRHLFEIRVSC